MKQDKNYYCIYNYCITVIKFCFLAIVWFSLLKCNTGNLAQETNRYELKNTFKSRLLEGNPKLQVLKQDEIIHIEITFNKKGQEDTIVKIFKEKDGSFYELKLIRDLNYKILDSLWLLAFAKKDTSFNYQYDFEKYPPTVPVGFDEWNYNIGKSDKNGFILTKTHLKDSTFKEEYFYDRAFKFQKVSLFYGGDTLIFR